MILHPFQLILKTLLMLELLEYLVILLRYLLDTFVITIFLQCESFNCLIGLLKLGLKITYLLIKIFIMLSNSIKFMLGMNMFIINDLKGFQFKPYAFDQFIDLCKLWFFKSFTYVMFELMLIFLNFI